MGKRVLIVAVTFIAAGAQGAPLEPGQTVHGQCVKIVDGDTVQVATDAGQLTVNLAGVDAPELKQPSGLDAHLATVGHALGKMVDVRVHEVTDDGELVASVGVADSDLSLELVTAGLAWCLPGNDALSGCQEAEAAARSDRLGLWSDTTPIPPWDWRDGVRPRQAEVTPRPTTLAEIAVQTRLKRPFGQSVVIDHDQLALDPKYIDMFPEERYMAISNQAHRDAAVAHDLIIELRNAIERALVTCKSFVSDPDPRVRAYAEKVCADAKSQLENDVPLELEQRGVELREAGIIFCEDDQAWHYKDQIRCVSPVEP